MRVVCKSDVICMRFDVICMRLACDSHVTRMLDNVSTYLLTLVGVDSSSLVACQVAVAAPKRTSEGFDHVLQLVVVSEHNWQQVLRDAKVKCLVCIRVAQAREKTVLDQLRHIL